MLYRYAQTNSLSADDRPATAAALRDLGGHRRCRTGLSYRPCRSPHLLHLKPRFRTGGYAALDHFPSRAPNHTRRTPDLIEAQVIALRQQHPAWGKQRLADELAKANDWTPLVSPNTVKRILRDAGRWDATPVAAKKGA